jgi:hypothetical protein
MREDDMVGNPMGDTEGTGGGMVLGSNSFLDLKFV